jgi:hypothetical protein
MRAFSRLVSPLAAAVRGPRETRGMISRKADPMSTPFRAKPKPFLDTARRDWQFETFAWLLRHCGGHVKFLETVPVLPIEQHFPDRGMSGHAGVAALFRRVRDHAGMADWPCIVEPSSGHDGTSAECASPAAERIRVIYYDPAQRQPAVLVARFARELARYLVDTFGEQPPGGAGFREPAIDLATVFTGFGVFMANASVDAGAGNLNEGELVHGLAMFCLLRRSPPESLAPYLNPHLRKYLRLASRDLAQFETGFQRLREVPAAPPAVAAGESPGAV